MLSEKSAIATMVRTALAIAFPFFLLLPGIGSAKTITAAGEASPPIIGPEPGQGLALDLVQAAFKTQGYDVDMKWVPWARAVKGVKDGMYDILITAWWTAEQAESHNYSTPYFPLDVKFIKSVNDDFEFYGLDSLSGKSVGVIRGYGYGDTFLNADNFERPETSSLLQNLKMLSRGRIDLAVAGEIAARFIITRDAPELQDKLVFTNNALSSNYLHVTSGLKNPKNKVIITTFNKGLEVIKKNGTFDAILTRYGLNNP